MAAILFDLPRPTRRYRFALTPLADAMFQLLIFFMLSSSLTPYSLLTVRSGANGGAPTTGAGGTQPATQQSAIWTLDNGSVTTGGQVFAITQLADLARAQAETGHTDIVLIARPAAQVQDVASALAALRVAGIPAVQLVQGGS